METTLPLPFLPSVDLAKGAAESTEGLTRVQLSYLACVFFTATSSTIDALLQFLQRHVSIEAYVDVSSIDSIEDIVTILDAGARRVFVKRDQLRALSKYADRVVVIHPVSSGLHEDGTLNGESDSSTTAALSQSQGGVLIDAGGDVSSVAGDLLAKFTAAKISPIFFRW